jgi:hypothetical protein
MSNLRLALRTLFKMAFVTAVAIPSIARGIDADSAIFSIFTQLLHGSVPRPGVSS